VEGTSWRARNGPNCQKGAPCAKSHEQVFISSQPTRRNMVRKTTPSDEGMRSKVKRFIGLRVKERRSRPPQLEAAKVGSMAVRAVNGIETAGGIETVPVITRAKSSQESRCKFMGLRQAISHLGSVAGKKVNFALTADESRHPTECSREEETMREEYENGDQAYERYAQYIQERTYSSQKIKEDLSSPVCEDDSTIASESVPENIYVLDQYKEDKISKGMMSGMVENFLSSDQRLLPAWV
jgi:hypothetical protein